MGVEPVKIVGVDVIDRADGTISTFCGLCGPSAAIPALSLVVGPRSREKDDPWLC